jgi:hypothetical protein
MKNKEKTRPAQMPAQDFLTGIDDALISEAIRPPAISRRRMLIPAAIAAALLLAAAAALIRFARPKNNGYSAAVPTEPAQTAAFYTETERATEPPAPTDTPAVIMSGEPDPTEERAETPAPTETSALTESASPAVTAKTPAPTDLPTALPSFATPGATAAPSQTSMKPPEPTPTARPTAAPSVMPTQASTTAPTAAPTNIPVSTPAPTAEPTAEPSPTPTSDPEPSLMPQPSGIPGGTSYTFYSEESFISAVLSGWYPEFRGLDRYYTPAVLPEGARFSSIDAGEEKVFFNYSSPAGSYRFGWHRSQNAAYLDYIASHYAGHWTDGIYILQRSQNQVLTAYFAQYGELFHVVLPASCTDSDAVSFCSAVEHRIG